MHAARRRRIRSLSAALLLLWVFLAVAIAAVYRPGGPLDLLVVSAAFLPIAVAGAGYAWPAVAHERRDHVAIVWAWVAAMLFGIPLLVAVVDLLVNARSRTLVPSFEAAYGGAVALLAMCFYSLIGLVHRRTGEVPVARRGILRTGLLAAGATIAIAFAFGAVAFVNDRAVGEQAPAFSRFGPTDPSLVPPPCDRAPALGQQATVSVVAAAHIDRLPVGSARLDGRRAGQVESWTGDWATVVGAGGAAYIRAGQEAWLRRTATGPWEQVARDPFGLLASTSTLDAPIIGLVVGPGGAVLAEDVGLEVVAGARARHCRTFVDGDAVLRASLPLRWLVSGDVQRMDRDLGSWRGELDWWVFGDGGLGRAVVSISGLVRDAWSARGVQGELTAELTAVDRIEPVAPSSSPSPDPSPDPSQASSPAPAPSPAPSPASSPTTADGPQPPALQSAAP